VNPAPAERPSPVDEFKLRTTRKLDDLRCPVHGQAPRLRFEGSSLRDVAIRMSGCCDRLIALANQRIVQA
jgi:hypothetical protein